MQRRFVIMSCVLMALLVCALPVQAQGGSHAVTCDLDAVLVDGAGIVTADVFLQLVLVLDTASSTVYVNYYDVRGSGSYVASGESGRIVLMDGRYSNLSGDNARFVEARFVSGPLQGTTYIIKPTKVVDGKVSGTWTNPADPLDNGTLTGNTDC